MFCAAAHCDLTGQPLTHETMPVCPVKHLAKHCPDSGCPNCRTSEQESCCRVCQIAKIIACVDIDRFYRRQYKKRGKPSDDDPDTSLATTVPPGADVSFASSLPSQAEYVSYPMLPQPPVSILPTTSYVALPATSSAFTSNFPKL
jgi:hypothetical protein